MVCLGQVCAHYGVRLVEVDCVQSSLLQVSMPGENVERREGVAKYRNKGRRSVNFIVPTHVRTCVYVYLSLHAFGDGGGVSNSVCH